MSHSNLILRIPLQDDDKTKFALSFGWRAGHEHDVKLVLRG